MLYLLTGAYLGVGALLCVLVHLSTREQNQEYQWAHYLVLSTVLVAWPVYFLVSRYSPRDGDGTKTERTLRSVKRGDGPRGNGDSAA